MTRSNDAVVALTLPLLKRHPLPSVARSGDKEHRGAVLIVGGSPTVPGAAILAGLAALRVGCGKLAIATDSDVAPLVAQALPESMVIGLGSAPSRLPSALRALIDDASAILVGVGMDNNSQSARLAAMVARVSKAPLILDAGALAYAANEMVFRASRCVLTPHSGEMATLSSHTKDYVERNAKNIAIQQQKRLGVTIVLKGSTTYVCDSSHVLQHDRGNSGLGTSGSGDVLAGAMAGLLARGSALPWAAAWAVYLHGRAGQLLAARVGPVGFLAREVADQIPAALVASRQR
jgi:ADP-dependent NAD(P)H-hydrate dehydratase